MQGNLLFFDTETTGFALTRSTAGDPRQPHTVQLAAQLVSISGVVLGSFSTMIKLPEGMEVPERAAAVHGIDAETANRYGIEKIDAMKQFNHLLRRADTIVAHNKDFDITMVNVEAHRTQFSLDYADRKQFCTMAAATPIVNLPPTPKMVAAGFNKPKSPKLEECIQHFFGETLEGAHDAMIDVQACQRVYFHLKSMETENA